MKKIIKASGLLLVVSSLAACQEVILNSSNSQNSGNTSSELNSENSGISSSESTSISNSTNSSFNPFSLSYEPLIFEDIPAGAIMSKITKAEAENIVDNDLTKYNSADFGAKRSTENKTKRECTVARNRSDSTYSIRYHKEEKYQLTQIDVANRFYYTKITEYSKNEYFVEPDLIRHSSLERWTFFKDNYLYEVRIDIDYYEDHEDTGKYEAYYTKRTDLSDEEIDENFIINENSMTYFGKDGNLSKVDKSVLNNFNGSTSYYTANRDAELNHTSDYTYYGSSTKGYLRCDVDDACKYKFEDLIDYPSDESFDLKTIEYNQKFSLLIMNYFSFKERSTMNSVSKEANGKAIRTEKKETEKNQYNSFTITYPDLTKLEEREYTPPITK